VTPDLSLAELVDRYFLHHGYRGFPVVEGGRAVGVVSVSSLQGVPESERREKRVRDVMHALDDSRTIGRDAMLKDALDKMSPADVGRLLVVDGDRLEGLVTKTGVVRLLEMQRILGSGLANRPPQ
jgi:predicted transcriptional regulator